MRTFLLLCALVSSPLIYASQDVVAPVIKRHRLFIGISVSPDLCYRTLSYPSSYTNYEAYRNEIPKCGVTAGVQLIYAFPKLIELQAGILYSDKGYQTPIGTDWASGNGHPGIFRQKWVYDFHYLDIPLRVNFLAGKKKIRFCGGIGLTTNIFLTETSVYTEHYENGDLITKRHYTLKNKPVDLSPLVSAGIDCRIRDRSHIRIEPTFTHNILNTADSIVWPFSDKRNPSVKEYYWSVGLNLSYYFGL
ncbi:MAG: hypothetical protein JWO03_1738 [Bacteroidetes bacterium]|nr:hypothetical protein [Bacteroidota bacterium]